MGVSRAVVKGISGALGAMLVLAGLGMLIFTQPYLENENVRDILANKFWIPVAFVYGVCSAVVLLGVLQLASCKFNIPIRLVLFSLIPQYEILGIFVFLAFLGVFILLLMVKETYLEILIEVLMDPEFTEMYSQLELNQDQVFIAPGYCKGKSRIQDCTDLEMIELFPEPHDRVFFDVGFLLESYSSCSGMNTDPTIKYFFTGDLYFCSI